MVRACAIGRGKTATRSKKAGNKGATDQRNKNRLSSVAPTQLIRLYELHSSCAISPPNRGVTGNRSVAMLSAAFHTLGNGRDATKERDVIHDTKAQWIAGTDQVPCRARHLHSYPGRSMVVVRRKVNVAIVAPSMRILGGQAVQADRLVRAWSTDPEISAWLVPVNPLPPGILRHAADIKYVRTLATQAVYWPTLISQLRHADIVHVFSASYYSFLLAPLPAVAIARLLGKPVVLNYRSGEAPDHLKRSWIARTVLRSVDCNAVPSSFLHDVFRSFAVQSTIVPNIVDVDLFRFKPRAPHGRRILSTRNLEPMYNVACALRAFRRVQDKYPDSTLTLVGSGSEDQALRRLAVELNLQHVRFAGRVAPSEIHRYYADADIYLQTPDIDNMPSSVLEAFASGCPVVATHAGGVPAILTDRVHGLLVPCDDAEYCGGGLPGHRRPGAGV